ncbi:MAG TPA: class I SAM-dependent methyltransferase [bacterium]|nr:class I SAM-dependent methyltransferase [bacterium]HPT29784.1 class I SAM-dependent methyltransferase [bacterium]
MLSKNKLLNYYAILGQLNQPDGKVVADLGCGQFGYFVFPLARLVGGSGKVYAIDVLPGALEAIKRQARLENLAQIETVWSDLEVAGATPVHGKKLDAAFLINVLYQAHDGLDMIREAVRMLKSGGKLIVVEWSEKAKELGPPPSQRIKKDKLLAGITSLGLELDQDFSPGSYHYGLTFKKK